MVQVWSMYLTSPRLTSPRLTPPLLSSPLPISPSSPPAFLPSFLCVYQVEASLVLGDLWRPAYKGGPEILERILPGDLPSERFDLDLRDLK